MKNFKTYYEVLSNIMGENVETMQRAISEFIYNEELLKDVSTIDLTDAQERNLISVLCSKENKYDINSLDDLNRYNEIANQKSMERLKKAYDEYLSDPEGVKRRISYLAALTPLKKCICEEFLGIDYAHAGRYITRDYGDSYKYIMALYDLQSEISKTDMYTENELDVLTQKLTGKELEKMLNFAINYNAPIAIRYPRDGYIDNLNDDNKPIEICKSEIIKEGTDITIIGFGKTVFTATKVANLRKDKSFEIINLRFLKPLDKETLLKSIRKTKNVVVIEDNVITGGVCTAIKDLIANEKDINAKYFAYPDEFIKHGLTSEIETIYKLSAEEIAKII